MIGWIARWLGVGGPTTARGLREQAHDPDPEQRRLAAERLGAISDPWVRDELLLLLKDMMSEVRAAARDALRKQGPAATGVLIKALEDGDPRIAVPAAELLGELKDPTAVRPLLLVMKFGALEIRAAAIRALIRYGQAAVPALEAATKGPDPWTRMRGEEILAVIRAAAPAPPSPRAAPEPPTT
ncbi:MAG: HEAT repeat domain-containing protein [Planctomycetes bacterium]|nr:HEAT repeat domain-containing protein [Planctomycetota bacterium]